jgi:hypothetical protein
MTSIGTFDPQQMMSWSHERRLKGAAEACCVIDRIAILGDLATSRSVCRGQATAVYRRNVERGGVPPGIAFGFSERRVSDILSQLKQWRWNCHSLRVCG